MKADEVGSLRGGSLRLPRHIAGLDGVRAVAVGGVIAHHLQLPWTAFGWTGVPLFFVLSGFLITGILLEDKGSPQYYSTFYARRSLRIFPIYYLTIGAVALFFAATGQNIADWPYFVTYTQNWFLPFSNPPDLFGALGPFTWALLHTWSLATEEQFYLLWPLAVAMLPGRALLKLVALIIVLGNLSRFLLPAVTGRWATGYFSLFAQMDMLAWGALGAIIYSGNLLPQKKLVGLAKLVALIGMGMLVVPWRNGSAFTAYPEAWLTSLEGRVLFGSIGPFYLSVIILAMTLTPLTNLLELRPVRYCGKISYGLYLYHWPVITAISFSLGTGLLPKLIMLAATLVTAATSYHFIERPILRYKERIAPRVAGTSRMPMTAPIPEPVV